MGRSRTWPRSRAEWSGGRSWSHSGSGVAGSSGAWPGRTGREWAAVLATHGVLSHRSAGARMGVLTWNGRIEVTAKRGRPRIPGLLVHTARLLHPDDLVLDEDGPPRTSWARTTIDLAAGYDLHKTTRYLERSEIARVYDGFTLAAAMNRAHGHHGLKTLVAALNAGHHLDPQHTRSPKEDAYLKWLRDQGAGDYRFNHWMWVHDRFIEADVWFPASRLIVELDSRWHDTAGARHRDASRDAACRAAGIEVRRLR